ncbi:NEL-type E3 ubiquitin ligase domain-containing protein [Pseudomonas indica]|uniref:NEL-type E3 ubiquitin ligase domain-containing protein n=1 Tax=Pseudomonas indica TaxID=137658 RepID=UPI0023F76616|nr:NEL-type E3 ubiquitin ligase domain-containing protein [Pseudomonas indica]MBU3059374.1 hypothetical protein [Pseudomonas indica]
MNTPPLSPSISSSARTSSSSDTSETGSENLQWEPGNRAPALQLPPGLHVPEGMQLQPIAQWLAAYQGNIALPVPGQSWVLPHAPRFFPGEPSTSSSPSMCEVQLRKWVGEASSPEMAEHRRIAEGKILDVLNGKRAVLALENLKLGELPDIFGHPEAQEKLSVVELSCCELNRLPASLMRLPNLRHFSMTGCPVTELPEFDELPHLKSLYLVENDLEHLPNSIGRLKNLQRLIADSNNLQDLPDSLTRLSKLEKLKVSFNLLTQLPQGMAGLTSLQSLNINSNLMQELPEDLAALPLLKLKANQTGFQEIPPVIFAMERLEVLKLSSNPISLIPPEIARLKNLDVLDIAHCRLTSLPEEIAQLPHDCDVEVGGNPLSQAIRSQFERIYQEGGPTLSYTEDEGNPVEVASQPLETNVAKWMKNLTPEQVQKWQQLGGEEHAGHLNTWLEFMDQTADFKNEQTRPRLEQRMRHLLTDLTRMLEDPEDTQLPIYLGIAEEATSSCRDRIAVGLNNMELQQINTRAGRGDLSSSQLMTLGREMFVRDQISHIAAEKVKRLWGVDEVEVHLAFQSGLQQRLGLTLGNQDMLYRGCSQVRDKDLRLAAQRIQAALDTPGMLRNFLADWEPMRALVRLRNGVEWRAIERKFRELEEQAYGQDGDTDWRALAGLGTQRDQAFHDLCAQEVSELMQTDLPSSSRPPEEPSSSKRPRLG